MRRLLFLWLLLLPAVATALTPERLEQAITEARDRVVELKFLRKLAARHDARVWLFGGTAAAFADYVKRFEEGKIPAEAADFDFTSIYRASQDADIVVDGSDAATDAIERELRARFPHFQGDRSAWEIRSLEGDPAGKRHPVKSDPDFARQHSDSYSTGLIEISAHDGEPVVRDLRDWEGAPPRFLQDAAAGTIHLYYSADHEKTARFKAGMNPPLFEVIRILAKAFQYDLAISVEDERRLREIVRKFNGARDLTTDYAGGWIEKNGKKLFQNAIDLERAWAALDRLGLREKLRRIRDDETVEGSLAWWMAKEPLPTLPLGRGTGKTAKELGLDLVAHETASLAAFDSITGSPNGSPNVFTSRRGVPGEKAVYGDGFYVREGTEGATGSGLTVRFRLSPAAREGTDFERHSEDYLLIKNRAALTVVPEALKLGVVDYFRAVKNGDPFHTANRGLVARLKRRVAAAMSTLSAAESNEVRRIVFDAIATSPDPTLVLETWFASLVSTKYPDAFHRLFSRPDGMRLACRALDRPEWRALAQKLPADARRGTLLVLRWLQVEKRKPDADLRVILGKMRDAIPRALTADDVLFVFDLSEMPVGTQWHAQTIDRLVVSYAPFFAGLRPTPAEARRYFALTHSPAGVRDCLKAFLPTARSAAEFLSFAKAAEESEYGGRQSGVLVDYAPFFGDLKPSLEEIEQAKALEGALSTRLAFIAATLGRSRTAEEFLRIADFGDTVWGNTETELVEIITTHAAHFASLDPTAAEMDRAKWLVWNPVLSLALMRARLPRVKSLPELFALLTAPHRMGAAFDDGVEPIFTEALPYYDRWKGTSDTLVDREVAEGLGRALLRRCRRASEFLTAVDELEKLSRDGIARLFTDETVLARFARLQPSRDAIARLRAHLRDGAAHLELTIALLPAARSAEDFLAILEGTAAPADVVHALARKTRPLFLALSPTTAERSAFAARYPSRFQYCLQWLGSLGRPR